MKRDNTTSNPLSRQWRWLAVVAVAIVATLAFFVASAFGDAGNPILGTIHGTLTPNADGTVTVTVRGQWHWYSHNSDCNTDRAGAGVGIIWNDPSGADRARSISKATVDGSGNVTLTTAAQTFSVGDHITVSGVSGGTGYNGSFVITGVGSTQVKYVTNPKATGTGTGGTVTDLDVFNGFLVSHNGISAYVGTKTATNGNPVDEMVHPSDIGNKAEGYPGYNGQTFFDPSPPNPNSYLSWKGGCGREPETATASPGPGSALEPSFLTCADGTLICGGAAGTDPATGISYGSSKNGHPWGSWGYTTSYSHTYASRSDVSKVCVNYYDVHGGGTGSKLQLVNGAKEITVDANGDNSIDTNAFDPSNGANCISFGQAQPTITTNASGPVTIGDSISDTATLSNGSSPTGTITFTAYAPKADGTADPTCSTPVKTLTVTVNGNNDYPSGAFTPSGTGSQIAGTYEWIASYSGDANNLPATTSCGDTGEQSLVNKHDSSLPTRQSVLISDTAKVTGDNPTGTVTFQLFTSPDCTTGKVVDSTVPLTNGLASTGQTALTDNGTYSWLVTYNGDSNNVSATSPCGTEQTSISGNDPNIAP
jgi:hypothetical protein